ncbi:xylan 1,4-beta-xylosidase [Streptosporangium nondiastaticum]|uniref:Xylan 1,4-beta-xylosidase n=1 Tax=Streptosporangium nondiastaticum TaxID=35764 RepID=A0A9X7JL64_9ACTN|nr:xylan 1,4-beta-xylosidase [Streptosporangium nondiastaticum]
MGRRGAVRTFRRAGRWRFTALVVAGALALAALLVLWATSRETGGDLPDGSGGDRSAAVELGWGFTHTQYSADRGDDAARRAAAGLLSAVPMPQNQHIMGWGVDNPEPRPGSYNFGDLDRRVAFMRKTNATPVLTLCCAPDWMKGGGERTDWSQKSLEKAPDRAHYEDFAKLAGVIAKRYPDIRHFIVWNEFKGFYDERKGRWNYEGYTELYNLVYTELKKQNSANVVGGPYISMDSNPPGSSSNASSLRGSWGAVDQRAIDALTYWNTHKKGADFLVVDGASYTREGSKLFPDEFAATAKFADVTTWLRRTTNLPVWWSEWYVEPADANDDRKLWTEQHRLAVHATAMMHLARSGVSAAFYWNPEETGADCPGCLWRSTELKGGGGGLPMLDLLTRFGKAFPPGAELRAPDVAGQNRDAVSALAAGSTVLVVNMQDRRLTVDVDGQPMDLAPNEIRWTG